MCKFGTIVIGILFLTGVDQGNCLITPQNPTLVPPCYECMLRNESRQPESNQILGACPSTCSCPNGQSVDTKPVCSPGVSIIRDGCGCCWICGRQAGESCSLRYKCDPAEKLHCFYESAPKDLYEGRSSNMATRKQLTLFPSHGEDTGVCWKINGRSCFLNNTWLAHSGVQKSGCRHQCVCIDGTLLCTDVCLQQELRRPPDALCDQPVTDSGEMMQLKLMPPGPGECCRRWMCVTVVNPDRMEDEIPKPNGASALNFQARAHCSKQKRETSLWSVCSQQCGLGVSARWTTETYDCQNVTQFRLCFWRPCEKVQVDSNKPFVPTLKFIRPAFLKFTTLNGDPTNPTPFHEVEPAKAVSGTSENKSVVVCQLGRAFRPRFCNWPLDAGQCCWPSQVRTKRLRFHCSGGKIVYHFFEWIQTCRCTPVPCEVLFVDKFSTVQELTV
ncbi:hypothetical protein CRM22_003736 [Opisthorchis felineus]|uniref:CTCK domain-containing protein n=1 Tax=Opisthorchis felineus TaxID=147828 RepID=A0A4S2M5Y3_OPIFE|nr:hypothetical protein CRM22_003736 [Opisthorchis felineus]